MHFFHYGMFCVAYKSNYMVHPYSFLLIVILFRKKDTITHIKVSNLSFFLPNILFIYANNAFSFSPHLLLC
jgi:hypothetical protein